ncbi:MAG: tetratricopeptide repeat protein [Gemmatimonadetes bacterium]|nr:tetratricopeptide repeat protein [Gemmatimonadota bacterium]
MTDDVRALSAELARDPGSLVFVALGEALRVRGRLDAAAKVALAGLEHHPNLADGHDLYARIVADAGDVERAADEWSIALALDPHHAGAHKGLGFANFQRGDLDAALEHLELALAADPTDRSTVQALHAVRQAAQQAASDPGAGASVERPAVFAGLEGADSGLLLVDPQGRVLAGGLRAQGGPDVAEEVAAYLAGVSQEADRSARLLELGEWRWIMAEGDAGHLHLSAPSASALLLLVRDKSVPSGRLAILAARAAEVARRWLEGQTL